MDVHNLTAEITYHENMVDKNYVNPNFNSHAMTEIFILTNLRGVDGFPQLEDVHK